MTGFISIDPWSTMAESFSLSCRPSSFYKPGSFLKMLAR